MPTSNLPKLPTGHVDAARRESLTERECACSQLELITKARAWLASPEGQTCSPEDQGNLEQEGDRRLNKAERHIQFATQYLFEAYADGYWQLVRPNAAKFAELLPLILTEVEREIAFPELASTIGETLDKQSTKWVDRTVFQGAITGSARWSDFRGKFHALIEREKQASKPLTHDHTLSAICDYTGATDTGSWLLTGAEFSIQAEFELHATASGIALGIQGVLDPLSFWLHRLFIDLRENRDPQASRVTGDGDGGYIRTVCKASATFCAKLEKLALENEHRLRSTRTQRNHDGPESVTENTDDLSKIEQQALRILETASAEAEALILSAIRANGGVNLGPYDLDTSGVRYAKDMALQTQQAGNTVATELLYNAYADRNMTRAASAEGFLGTLDALFNRVVIVLQDRADHGATKALREKWSRTARDRSAAGWFVARAPRMTIGAPITDPGFWSDLERRFRDLGKEFGDHFTASWISSVWGEEGHQWSFSGLQGRERQVFEVLAERGAVGLGHPAGIDALFFWLDWLKKEGANYHAAYQGRDNEGKAWQAGIIRKPCEASADQCFKQETRLVAPAAEVESLPEPQQVETAQGGMPRLNLDIINQFMKDEGYDNKELAAALEISVRAVSSLRNGGDYHGGAALTRLANLMNREVEDLYLP
jgi:hypothetical protein